MSKDFKVGDKVVIVDEGRGNFYKKGDVCTLMRTTPRDIWLADFNNHGNKHVEDDGFWYIGNNQGVLEFIHFEEK